MDDLEQPETDSTVQDVPADAEVTTTETATDEPGLMNQAEGAEEESDYEVGEKKYRVPSALKAHLDELKAGSLRQEDYTQKTQTVAEQRKALEAERQEFAQRQQFHTEHLEKIAEVKAIDRQLEQYQKLDWNAITDADPVQALKLDRQMRDLQQQRLTSVQSIEQAQAKAALDSQQATARGMQEARATLAREIPGYGTAELTKALSEAAKSFGYKPEELTNISDPRAIKLLHKAHLYDKLVAKTKASEPAQVTPITRVSGASATTSKNIGDPNLSDAEYTRMRREYIRKHR